MTTKKERLIKRGLTTELLDKVGFEFINDSTLMEKL